MSNRYYSFKVVTYNTDISLINSFISTTQRYAYIFHDKDSAPPHYHILCTFSQNKSFESVRRLMGGTQNTLCMPMTDKVGDFLYLTHSNAPEKFQYSSDLIVSNSLSYFQPDKLEVSNSAFINDILPTSMLSLRQLAEKYGRDFMKNYKAYFQYGKHITEQELRLEVGFPEHITPLPYSTFEFALCEYLFDYYQRTFGIELATLLMSHSQLRFSPSL